MAFQFTGMKLAPAAPSQILPTDALMVRRPGVVYALGQAVTCRAHDLPVAVVGTSDSSS